MMTTLQIEIKLMLYFGFNKNYIVPNVHWGAGLHECDLLVVTKSGYATEVEIKISKQDLKNDLKKKHCHKSNKIKALYFAVPEELVEFALENIPTRAGLLSVGLRVNEIRKPELNKESIKWSDDEIFNLLRLGTMRIYTLKQRLNSKMKKS